jgi:hypothetical protein
MNTTDFVANVAQLKEQLLESFAGATSTSEVATHIKALGLSPEQE